MLDSVFSIKCGIGATFAIALAAFVLMGVIQCRESLDQFKFGSDFRYTAKDVKARVDAEKAKAAIALVPVLIPLDFLFLTAFSICVALCSIGYANAAGIPLGGMLLLLVLPAIYFMSDFGEDILIARMLKAPETIDDRTVLLTRSFTVVKFAAFAASLIEAGFVLCLWKQLPTPAGA